MATVDNNTELDKRENVIAFLQNYHKVKARLYYSSDYDALIKLIDFDKALLNSGLTELELMAINLVYLQDLKRVDVAEMYDVTRQTVQKWLERATGKIARYYGGGVDA